MLKVVEKRDGREAGEELLLLDESVREGARRMLIEALKAELDDYIERHRSQRDGQGPCPGSGASGRPHKLTV
jgi:hypothetical protein